MISRRFGIVAGVALPMILLWGTSCSVRGFKSPSFYRLDPKDDKVLVLVVGLGPHEFLDTVEVVEQTDERVQVRVAIRSERGGGIDLPLPPEDVPVRLDAPLGDRLLFDHNNDRIPEYGDW